MYTFLPAGVQTQGVSTGVIDQGVSTGVPDQGVSAGVIAGGVAGGVAATAVLVLCCIVFAVMYLRKRKGHALNVETRYDLIGLVSSLH